VGSHTAVVSIDVSFAELFAVDTSVENFEHVVGTMGS